jgi:hypothetical protein
MCATVQYGVLLVTLSTYRDLSHSMSISPLLPLEAEEAEAAPLESFPLLELDPALACAFDLVKLPSSICLQLSKN